MRAGAGDMLRKSCFAAVVLAAAIGMTCSGAKAPAPAPTTPTPTSSTPPDDPANVVNMAGKWTGTLVSSNFSTHTIMLDVVQTGSCVDGAWASSPSEWVGAISGIAGANSYSGQMSLERTADNGTKCSGVAAISGSVGQTAIKWTSTGFSGDCPGGFPQSVTVDLRRQQ